MSERERAAWPRRLVRGLRRSDGQAILEFVLVLPLIVTLVFVIVQLGITFNNYIQVTDAARVAARAAAVARFNNDTPCSAAQNALSRIGGGLTLGPCDDTNCPPTPGDQCSVTVTHPWSIDLPLLPISDSGTLTGKATEAIE